MFVVICYDISDDERRHRISRALEGHGARVQRSVFECDLEPPQLERVKRILRRLMLPSEDSVRLYYICEGCLKKVEILEGGTVSRAPSVYIV
jgi:CRISPR-associated protein Cas2